MKWYPTGAEEAADLRTLPRREKLRVSQLLVPSRRAGARAAGVGGGGDRGGTVERAM